MSRRIQPTEAYAIMNLLSKEVTGRDDVLQVVDTASFTSIGESIINGNTMENILNSLSTIIGRTIVAVRPYTSKFGLIEEVNNQLFYSRVRKISYYSRYAEPAGDFNTDLYTNFNTGYDNGTNSGESTASMWKQNLAMPFELVFQGVNTFDYSTTILREQLKQAFTSEESFVDFLNGILTECTNDLEIMRENRRRATLLNHIGAVYTIGDDYPTMKVNLTTGYNQKFGTNYTSEELRSTYLKSFLEYMVATIKTYSRRLEYRTASFHMPFSKTVDDVEYSILRHTSKENQRLFMYSPLIIDSEAMVMPEIFNTNYLNIENMELVDFWQNFDFGASVKVKPAIPGKDTYAGTQVIGETVEIPYVVATLFDKDALMVNAYLDDSLASPVEAKKRYYNIFWHIAYNQINDLSENFVLFYMDDSGVTPTPGTRMTVTPDTVTITLNESGNGSVDVTITNMPEGAVSVALVNDHGHDWDIGVDSGNVYTISIDGDSSEESYTDHNVIIAVDENGDILSSTNITINVVVPEG